jgi:MFS family permease
MLQSRLSQRIGRRGLVAMGLLGLSVSSFIFGLIFGPGTAMLAGVVFGVFVGWLDALACSMAMDEADNDWPATSYALIMAFQNLGTLGSVMMAWLADQVGFQEAFALAAGINLLGLLALCWIGRRPIGHAEEKIWSV